MKKTLYRAFALLLTASFFFAMASPAFATSDAEDTFLSYAMPADIVTSSLINGIGVLPGDDAQEYEGVVQRCVDYLTDLGRVVDGKIDVWKREQVGENAWKYGADISLVEVIRSWLFDDDVIQESTVAMPSWIPSGTSYESMYITSASHSYGLAVRGPDYLCVGWSVSPLGYEIRGSSPGTPAFGYFRQYTSTGVASTSSGWDIATSDTAISEYEMHYFGTKSPEIEVSSGLNAGFIAPGSVVFGDAYPDWYRNIATIPLPGVTTPDDDIKALPFAPGQTLGDTLTIPQEDVWTGSGSYVDAPSVPGTVTLSDVLTAILSIPANIVEGIGNLLFPAVDGLTMSLSDFFPFCIPYDLFEFFTLLQAEPEAPKFEWKIPVPQLGRTFEVEVDLSAWDEVAQLFRNLELLAFIVGLAYVTREKFLRS